MENTPVSSSSALWGQTCCAVSASLIFLRDRILENASLCPRGVGGLPAHRHLLLSLSSLDGLPTTSHDSRPKRRHRVAGLFIRAELESTLVLFIWTTRPMCADGNYNWRQSQDKTEPRLSPALEGEELILGAGVWWGAQTYSGRILWGSWDSASFL